MRQPTGGIAVVIAGAAGLALGAVGAPARSSVPPPVPLVSGPHAISASSQGTNLEPPAVAFDGTNYLVVWADYRGPGSSVLAARVSPEGDVLPPGEIRLSTGPGDGAPEVSWDGHNYLVVWRYSWQSTSQVLAARVAPGGTHDAPFPVSGSFVTGNPGVSFNGTNHLVAWPEGDPNSSDIHGNRVPVTGGPLDGTGFAIADHSSDERQPAVASDGEDWLVAYRRNPYPYAVRVDATGSRLDPDGLLLDLSPNDDWAPSAAFGTTSYLVTWHEDVTHDVAGSRVTPAGDVLDPHGFSIASSSSWESTAATEWDGSLFTSVWTSAAGGFQPSDLRAGRIDADGAVLDPSGFDVATAQESEFGIDAAPAQPGRIAAAYVASASLDGPRQVFLRFVDRGPVPSTGQTQVADWFAFLHGVVHPNGQPTSVWFEWGRTPALGSTTAVEVVDGSGPLAVGAQISNLDSSTTYYVRLAAQNAKGTGRGSIRSFITLPTEPGPPPPPPPAPLPPPPPQPPGPPPVPRCVVPRVVGRRLPAARLAIRRARCRVGRVRRARSRRPAGVVIAQSPRPRTRLRPGSRVHLVLSRGR